MIRVVDVFKDAGPAQSEAEARARALAWAELRAGPRQEVPQAGPVATGPAMTLGEREWMRGASSATARRLFELGRGEG
jgi:hypothetical protein